MPLKQCDRRGARTPTQCQRDDEKLLKEIEVLKDANKALADKVQVRRAAIRSPR